jgi:hypothetical protein
MAHFPAMDPGPSGPDDFEYPTSDAALFILLAPGPAASATARRGALSRLGCLRPRQHTQNRALMAGDRPEKCNRPASIPSDGPSRLGLAASAGYLTRMILTARGELREH